MKPREFALLYLCTFNRGEAHDVRLVGLPVSHPWYAVIFGPIAMVIFLALFIFFMVAIIRGRGVRRY